MFSSFLELEIPSQISTETLVSYGKPFPCDKASKASEALKAQLESTLQCARNKTCKVTVKTKDGLGIKLIKCSSEGRRLNV